MGTAQRRARAAARAALALTRLVHQFAVILLGPVAPPLHLKGGVLSQLLACKLAVRLCPLDLARVALHLEVFVALGPAEAEHLQQGLHHHEHSDDKVLAQHIQT